MRDLYKRLNVSPTASVEAISSAINNCGHASLIHDSTTVLLNEEKRKAYDKVHAELTHIGQLRSRLGLTHAENWTGDAVNDFSAPSVKARSLHEELIAKLKPSIMSKIISTTKNFIFGILRAFAPLILLFGAFWLLGEFTSEPNKTPPPRSVQSAPAFKEPLLPFPYNGATRIFTNKKSEAPLQVVTSSGSNYLVKLVDVGSGKTVLDVFIRGGNTIKIDVPLGRYIIKYASGDKWYGYKHYFGPNTGYSKAETIFNFNIEGNRVSGYTITLYRVSNGNLRTKTIGASDF